MQDEQLHRPLFNHQNQQTAYDPFMNPPNIAMAEKHKLAMSVGTQQFSGSSVSVERCPCCRHAINKNSLRVCCSQDELSFLGVGHPLYYRLTKYFACLIILVWVSSGGLYILIQNLSCKEACAYFFGLPIMKLEQLDENPQLKTQSFNLLTCILLMVGVLYVKPKIQQETEDFKSKMLCPSAYTIMLQNLPNNITEPELREWIIDLFGAEPCKINLSYDLSPYEQAYGNKQKTVEKLNRLKIKGDEAQLLVPFDRQKVDGIEKEIQMLNKQLSLQNKALKEFNSESNRPKPSGTAFVTFDSKKTCEKIVEEWGDNVTKSFLNCLFGYVRSPYPICRKQYVLISMAPSPTDVIWENLTFSFVRNLFFEILAFLFMAVIILLAFKLQYKMVNYAFELKQERNKTGTFYIAFLSLSMSLIVLLLNMLLRLVILQFCKLQRYHSYTKFASSFANNYLFLYFINTSFTVYIVHGNWIEDSEQILLWDIHLIMLTNAFSEPLAKLFDPTMFYRHIMRMYVRNHPHVPYTQKYVHGLWEGHPMSVGDNYQYVSRMLLITMWFAYAAPLGVVFSLVGMLINYWVDRIYLVKVNKLPQSINGSVADRIISLLELLPLVYMCGTLQYTYKFGESASLIDFLAKFLNYGVVLIVIFISTVGYIFYKRRNFTQPATMEVTYQEAQYLFTFDYDSENPITQYQSEIAFLNRLLNSDHLDGQSSRRIKTIISKLQRKRSIVEMEQTRTEIYDIRQKLVRQKMQYHNFNTEMLDMRKVESNYYVEAGASNHIK